MAISGRRRRRGLTEDNLVVLPADLRERLDALATEAVADAHSATARAQEHSRATRRPGPPGRPLPRPHRDPDWPQEKIKSRLQKVRDDRQKASQQLDGTVDNLEPGHAALRAALELLDRPRELYQPRRTRPARSSTGPSSTGSASTLTTTSRPQCKTG